MFDTVADGFRNAFDAGRKMQDSWFASMNDAFAGTSESAFPFATAGFATTGFATKEWKPVMTENVKAVTDCVDVSFRNGMNVAKSACDTVAHMDENDAYKRTREFWDVAFDASRANVDAFNKAGRKVMDGVVSACSQSCAETASAKPASKPAK